MLYMNRIQLTIDVSKAEVSWYRWVGHDDLGMQVLNHRRGELVEKHSTSWLWNLRSHWEMEKRNIATWWAFLWI